TVAFVVAENSAAMDSACSRSWAQYRTTRESDDEQPAMTGKSARAMTSSDASGRCEESEQEEPDRIFTQGAQGSEADDGRFYCAGHLQVHYIVTEQPESVRHGAPAEWLRRPGDQGRRREDSANDRLRGSLARGGGHREVESPGRCHRTVRIQVG